MTPPLFHSNFGVFPLHQIAYVEVSRSINLKLNSREIIFEVFIPTYVITVPEHYRRTERVGRSSSSKVFDFGINRKRVCDFLLVRHSNLGPILHRFGDIAGFLCS